jgi:hypothetical protein
MLPSFFAVRVQRSGRQRRKKSPTHSPKPVVPFTLWNSYPFPFGLHREWSDYVTLLNAFTPIRPSLTTFQIVCNVVVANAGLRHDIKYTIVGVLFRVVFRRSLFETDRRISVLRDDRGAFKIIRFTCGDDESPSQLQHLAKVEMKKNNEQALVRFLLYSTSTLQLLLL